MSYNIGQAISEGDKWSAGVAYVTIPSDVDRESFIAHCYQTNTLYIKTEDGGYHKNIATDNWSFNFIDFPQKPGDNGSLVFYVQEPVHKELMVIGIVNSDNEIVDLVEGQFKLRKKWLNNFVEITGSAKDGYLSMTVDSQDNSSFIIHVNNENNNAELNIEVAGNIIINALNSISLISKGNHSVQVFDPNDNTKYSEILVESEEINASTDKFSINEGSSPITLGDQCKLIFDNLFDELGKSTVATTMGQMPLLNAQQIVAMKENTANILSLISFTD